MTALTQKQITELTSIIAKKSIGRAADKAKAIERFCAISEVAFKGNKGPAEAALVAPSMEEAVLVIKEWMNFAGIANERTNNTIPSAPTTPKKEEAIMPNAEKKTGPGRGAKAKYAGMHLSAIVEENVRRENTHGRRSLQIIMDNPGISVDGFVAKGGRLNDLNWDVKKGHVQAT